MATYVTKTKKSMHGYQNHKKVDNFDSGSMAHVMAYQQRTGAHDLPTLLDGPLTYINKIYIQQSANLK